MVEHARHILNNLTGRLSSHKAIASPTASNEAKNTKNNLWMADLYVSRQKASLANIEAHSLEDSNLGKWGAYRALDIARKVEKKFMTRPDFNKIRKTDQGYKKLVEEFAMEVGSDLLSRNMDPNYTPISSVVQEQSYKEQAEEFRQRAKKIASKHNTPREKAEYIVFAIRSFMREFVRPIQSNEPKVSKGVAQLLSEMEDLNKQKGRYLRIIGDSQITERISRLEALGSRLVFTVIPIAPTPPFLTKEPPNNINTMFGSIVSKKT